MSILSSSAHRADSLWSILSAFVHEKTHSVLAYITGQDEIRASVCEVRAWGNTLLREIEANCVDVQRDELSSLLGVLYTNTQSPRLSSINRLRGLGLSTCTWRSIQLRSHYHKGLASALVGYREAISSLEETLLLVRS